MHTLSLTARVFVHGKAWQNSPMIPTIRHQNLVKDHFVFRETSLTRLMEAMWPSKEEEHLLAVSQVNA